MFYREDDIFDIINSQLYIYKRREPIRNVSVATNHNKYRYLFSQYFKEKTIFSTLLIHNSSNVDLLKHGAKTHCRKTDTVKGQKNEGKFQMKEYIYIYIYMKGEKGNISVK